MRPVTHKRVGRLEHPAKYGCRHCYGTGFVGYYVQFTDKKLVIDGRIKREEIKTPLLCACVSRRGKLPLKEADNA